MIKYSPRDMQQSLEVGNIGLEELKSFDVFSTEALLELH